MSTGSYTNKLGLIRDKKSNRSYVSQDTTPFMNPIDKQGLNQKYSNSSGSEKSDQMADSN